MRDINFPFSKYVNTQGICDRLDQKHLKILRLGFFFLVGWFFGFAFVLFGVLFVCACFLFYYYFIASESL